jgi:hypothetical protein
MQISNAQKHNENERL